MILTREITYQDHETICRGFIAYDNNPANPKPCVMVAHDWGGRNEDACNKAQKLATMGFIGFAIDMYGQAQLGQDKIEKRALMTPLVQNRKKLAARILAAFNTATQLPQVDKTKIAVIGYCFGGLCALDLARTGADVKGVVSFHGILTAPEEEEPTKLKAKILVLHGYDDPLVLPEQVNQFAQEMTTRKADWQIHMYGLTAHSFTNPEANDDEMGLHYNETADRRSWISMELFLNELFAN
ncbi:dienelactone hydrolase family protein [Legionella feeleii]|uniref:Dienelactone hydrolase family protein n=1 Tax=Legionella feeleii TaxID=453 RepID=A0A0W0TML5_9GAMM|nr:dienelactone hydrolase family protein [Legionella feeleii]KTC96848.1 dienelactone hydrolase family protein [Legionella feeleii]SPX60918.1 dienelactone hydrolase family protein [Legionella feeleii]